jgi:RNA methyltransferase, TrmH family
MKPQPVITSRSNERVKALREGFRGKASKPGELVSLEGPNLLEEAVKAEVKIEALFVREGLEPAFSRLRTGALYVLSEDVFASAVDTQSPQGMAALVRIPAAPHVDVQALRGTSLLVESVQDPGNLGTLLRSAAAFGAEAVFLAGDTVNPWSPKVMRASAGSVFRVPMRRVRSLQELRGVPLYAAMAQEAFVENLLRTRLEFPCVLMVGNEGSGLSGEAVEAAAHKVWIPCATESLNAGVAGSLLLYEAMRQRGGL